MFPFRIKIWHKLFFSILLVVSLILAINMGLNRLSFQQGFSQYIEEVRLKKIDRLKENLTENYQQHHSWDFLDNNFKLWHQLLSDADLAPPPKPERRGPERRGPEMRSHPREFGPPGGFSRHDRPRPPRFLPLKISLLDADQKHIIGPPDSTENLKQPILIDKKTIGYLSMLSIKPLRSKIDKRFAKKQFINLLLTALASFIIAIIASLLLAKVFNRPISRLADMARELTSGNFEKRIQIKSNDELADLAKDLNKLAETLYQNQQSRRQWIADISHELRTPLTVLRGELEAMEDGIRTLNKTSIQSLSLEVKQLNRLVDDLYQLSTADQGALSYNKETVDAIALLTSVIDSFEANLRHKKMHLTFSGQEQQAMIFADPQRITQLFNNLLENSCRYTHEGGQIKVHCLMKEKGQLDSSLVIAFEDSTPGVSPDLIPRLFERLFRVEHSRNRETGGSGLGLSIVKSITQAHNAEISAEPSSLGGLKISLVFPVENE